MSARARKTLLAVAAMLVGATVFFFWLKHQGNEISLNYPASPLGASEESAELSLMIYNVQARPILDNARDKFPQISPRLNGFNIVAIQECFQRNDLLFAQAAQPNKAYFGELSAFWKLAGPGLAMLSDLPVLGVETRHFAHVGEFQNWIASKGVMMMRFSVNGMILDVYNTHMEAGDTEAAHEARDGQAQEVIDLVSRLSPPEHSVILCGDFNMGPHRAGKAFAAYTPNHYSNEGDMLRRTASFEKLRAGVGLQDAHDVLLGRVNDDIERFLYRSGAGHTLTPLSLVVLDDFRRADGSALSDGSPKALTFMLSRKK